MSTLQRQPEGSFALVQSTDLRGYLPSLDGWRAIAILIVMAFHSRDVLIRVFGAPTERFALGMQPWGMFGVDIFFAISGLLITSRLLAEESSSGRISLKSFYLRRAFRILPPSLMYLSTVLVLGSLGLIAFRADSWRAALLFYINYTTEPQWYVGHFWSLAVEEHFYAFWPALLLFMHPKKRFSVAVALCFTVLFWRVLNFKFSAIGIAMGSPYFTHQGRTDFQLDGILWGATFALAYQRFSKQAWIRRMLTLKVGSVLLILVLGSLEVHGGWKLTQALLLFRRVAVPMVLLTTILNCRGIVAAVLESAVLKKIGRLSYSLYLWQQLFLVWGIETATHVVWMQRFPYNLCCAAACALASYHLLERPFIRLGHQMVESAQARRIKALQSVA